VFRVISQPQSTGEGMRAVCSSRRSAGWSILLTVGIVARFGDADWNQAAC
jgi:hypothetical protein